MSVEGWQPWLVYDSDDQDFNPVWFPGGRAMAIVIRHESVSDIYAIVHDAEGAQKLTCAAP